MHVLEFKFSVFVVVEFNLEPAGLGVTSITLLAMISTVGIVHFMAKIAIRRGICVTLVRMAIRANYIFVAFFQLKVGFVMIEARNLPRLFDVTIFTQLAQTRFVPVIITMTGDTVFFGFAKL